MTIRWERLEGDTGVFALRMAFASDPDDGRYIDPEVGLSWGSFQIWVEGRNLCAHLEEGERIDSVPLVSAPGSRVVHPPLESPCFTKNAFRSGPKATLDGHPCTPLGFRRRQSKTMNGGLPSGRVHGRTGGFGMRFGPQEKAGLFPDVVIRRFRDSVEVSWGPVRSEGAPYRFDSTESAGFARLPPRAVAEPLHAMLSSASEYLSSLAGESRRIEALRRNLQALESSSEYGEDHDYRLMWLAGLGTNDLTVRTGWQRAVSHFAGLAEAPRRAMLEVSESPIVVTGSCQAALMFGSFAPDIREQDVLNLARTMVDLYSPQGRIGGDPNGLPCHANRRAPVPRMVSGYELAEELHQNFDGAFVQDEFVDIDGLIRDTGRHGRGAGAVGSRGFEGFPSQDHSIGPG